MDQVDKIILQVQGQEEIKVLNQALELERDTIRQLNEQLKAGAISQQQFEASARVAGASIERLNARVIELEKSTGGLRAQGLLQLQYVLDDLVNTTGGWERKLAAISNNIPGLAMAIGGKHSMAIAGAVGIAGTALIALAPVAKAAWDALAGGGDGPEPVVRALDTAEEKLKGIRHELEGILKAASPEEAETAKLVKQALAGQGDKVLGGLAATLEATGQGAQFTQAEQDQLTVLEGKRAQAAAAEKAGKPTVPSAVFQGKINTLRQQLRQRNFDAAGTILAEAAGTGAAAPGARARLRQLIGANPGAFAPGLGKQLEDLEPEKRQEEEEFWNNVDAEMRENERRIDARKKRDAEAKHKAADLERRRRHAAAVDKARTDEDIRFEEQAERDREQRRKAAGRRDAQRTEEDIKFMDDAPRAQAERDVTALSRRLGRETGGRLGGTPTAEQAEAMARDVLRLQQGGLGHEQAVWMSVYRMLQQIQRNQAAANAAMNQQMQMFGGGGPDMGNFSMLPPIW